MAFLPNIPLSTDQLSISQGNILNNFNILGAIAGNSNVSSSSINSASGFNWIYLPVNGSIPPSGASFVAGAVGLYGALNSVSSTNELYINKTITTGSGTSVAQIASTAASLTNPGWSYFPSGVLMKWVFPTVSGAGSNSFTFQTGANIPSFIELFSVLLTPQTVGLVGQVTSISATTFTINSSGAGTFYMLAIGR